MIRPKEAVLGDGMQSESGNRPPRVGRRFRDLFGRVPDGVIDGLIVLAAVFVGLLGVGVALMWALRDF